MSKNSILIVLLILIIGGGTYYYLEKQKKDDVVKVGMITTLSGGGSGLGIDVRDGFLLAVKDNKNIQVLVKDDQRKPDIAVQLADKMIQSDKVDVLTGIIWSNLAMAVVPAAVNQDIVYLSPNAGPSALAAKVVIRITSMLHGKMIICMKLLEDMLIQQVIKTLSFLHLTIQQVKMH